MNEAVKLDEAFKLLLSLTLSGSILALLIIAAKPIIRFRVPKVIQYYIWLLVLLRLVLPFSFESSLSNSLFYSMDKVDNVADSSGANLAGKTQYGNRNVVGKPVESSLTVQKKVKAGYYNDDTDHAAYLNDLFMQTGLLIWVLGVFAALGFHISGYLRFVGRLKQENTQASVEEKDLLRILMDGMKIENDGINLCRNRFSTTPMLIGLFKPCIVIPDLQFTPKQLECILRHELTHFRRLDIIIKWLSVIVASIHWFNPFMILIKREINHTCELSCDERVLRDMNEIDRQAYGETLLQVVAERKYPSGVISTTMCEEKKTLKERLTAIMKYGSMPKHAVLLSAILFVVFAGTAITLGAAIGKTPDSGPEAGKSSGHTSGAETGTLLSSKNYDLQEIASHRTAYVGDNSKDLALVGNLPLPDTFFMQQYISLKTKEEPYGLTVYYEAAGNAGYPGDWPISAIGSKLEVNSKLNALVLFAMIGNVEDITFAFRGTKSTGDLERDTYDMVFSFSRRDIESEYGGLTELADDPEKLVRIIDEAAKKWSIHISKPLSQAQMAEETDKLLVAIMSSPMASSNPGDYIRENQTEYDEIVAMGKDILPYLKSILDSGDKGLRGVLVGMIYRDIEDGLEK